MYEDGIWEVRGNHARAEIADAYLLVVHASPYGYRWSATGYRDGELQLDLLRTSSDVNSEAAPYPTMKAAMDACERFYSWEWHGVR